VAFRKEEYRAAHHIERLGFQYYLPEIREEKSKARGLLFPGYIFVRLLDSWQHLLHQPGIARIFLHNEKPVPVRESDIKKLKSFEDPDGFIKFPRRVRVGMMARIRESLGAMAGQRCRVVALKDQNRCVALVSIMGRDVRTVLNEEALDVVA
jgi:transcription antitermination factor NusG